MGIVRTTGTDVLQPCDTVRTARFRKGQSQAVRPSRRCGTIVDTDIGIPCNRGIITTTIDITEGTAEDLQIGFSHHGSVFPGILGLVIIVTISAAEELTDEDTVRLTGSGALTFSCRHLTLRSSLDKGIISVVNSWCRRGDGHLLRGADRA